MFPDNINVKISCLAQPNSKPTKVRGLGQARIRFCTLESYLHSFGMGNCYTFTHSQFPFLLMSYNANNNGIDCKTARNYFIQNMLFKTVAKVNGFFLFSVQLPLIMIKIGRNGNLHISFVIDSTY